MKASEVTIGHGFVASAWNTDWRSHWKPGKAFPGELLSVSMMTPYHGSDFLKEMLAAHKNLSADSASQIDGRQCRWVAGVRESRSRNVKIVEWAVPTVKEGGAQ